MDESLQELEAELKSLQPRRPSAQWSARLAREMAAELPAADRAHYTTATSLSSWKWFGWRTAAAAAAVILLAALGVLTFKPAQPAPAPQVVIADPAPRQDPVDAPVARERYQPVAATNVLYDLKDEGLVQVDGDIAAHRLRYRYLDTYTLKSPRGNASLTWSVPRDEIRVLPASFH